MRGLRHKVRHKNREGFVEWNANGAGPFAARTTEFLDKLWLKVHAAQKVLEARVRAERIIAALRIPPWLASGWECRGRRLSTATGNHCRRHGPWRCRPARHMRGQAANAQVRRAVR